MSELSVSRLLYVNDVEVLALSYSSTGEKLIRCGGESAEWENWYEASQSYWDNSMLHPVNTLLLLDETLTSKVFPGQIRYCFVKDSPAVVILGNLSVVFSPLRSLDFLWFTLANICQGNYQGFVEGDQCLVEQSYVLERGFGSIAKYLSSPVVQSLRDVSCPQPV